MGRKSETKLIILIVLFLVTSFFVYNTTSHPVLSEKKQPLKDFLADIDGYKTAHNIPMEEDIYKFLNLDDYVFTNYIGSEGKVTLFIGYYYSANKISAAHSPLSCFPGQGWTINEPSRHHLNVGNHEIDYAEIIATLSEQKELVLYWYQSHLNTTPHVFKNKMTTMHNKFMHKEEQHAFVRVSIPFADTNYAQAQKAGTNFIKTFYPKFINFIEDKQ